MPCGFPHALDSGLLILTKNNGTSIAIHQNLNCDIIEERVERCDRICHFLNQISVNIEGSSCWLQNYCISIFYGVENCVLNQADYFILPNIFLMSCTFFTFQNFCMHRLLPNNTARNYFKQSLKEQGSTPRASWRLFHWTLCRNQRKQHMLLLEVRWILPAEASETRSPSVHPVTPGNDVDNKLVIIFVPSHRSRVLGVNFVCGRIVVSLYL